MFSANARAEAAEARAEELAAQVKSRAEFTDYLEARVKALAAAGKIDQQRKKDMLGELGQVDLSVSAKSFYDRDGKFVPPLIALEIAAYEKLQPSRFDKEAIQRHNGDTVDLSHRPLTPPASGAEAKGEFDEFDQARMKSLGLTPEAYREWKRKQLA
jgi:hypothetical protein